MDTDNNLNENNLSESNDIPVGLAQSELVVMLSGYLNKIIKNSVLRIIVAKIILVTAIVISVLFLFSFFLYIVPSLQELSGSSGPKLTNNIELKNDP